MNVGGEAEHGANRDRETEIIQSPNPRTNGINPFPGNGCRSEFGEGLLPKGFGENLRAQVLKRMKASYRQIADNGIADWKMWEQAMYLVGKMRTLYEEAGISLPAMAADEFWARSRRMYPSRDPEEHIEWVYALLRPVNELVSQHVRDRLGTDGNVHAWWAGMTGLGKSSCAIAFMDWIHEIQPTELTNHLTIDPADWKNRLAGKQSGQSVMQDENLALAGEGSQTLGKLLGNIEDTLRASQVNLMICHPQLPETVRTMQLVFEAIGWNRAKQWTLFMVYVKGRPRGIMAAPWCRKELYESYKPWKAKNVQRTLATHFRDNKQQARMVAEACEDPHFNDYMLSLVNKPKKADLKNAFNLFGKEMTTAQQVDRAGDFLYTVLYNFENLEPKFEEWFNIVPGPGMKKIAKKCYQE